ncbi:Uracil-DNA glycosylase family protein [gamma proteobacterium HdN1]|nr:Uracil-DNA glycosylase family protein [gamma proteobacterium HdN1]
MVQVRACTVCTPFLPLGPRPVLQVHPDARILIASQAPGRKVHETGIPFNDPSGVRLREWLGISPEIFYDPHKIAIIPMGFCYPGRGRSGDLPPRPECAPLWRARLLSHLKNLELTIAIGKYAIAYHLPDQRKRPLTDVVRDWQAHWPHTIAIPHPSPRNNIWLKRNPWFEAELLPTLRPLVQDVLARSGGKR